ncbi:AlpA family phage regulatory protein [Ferrimonas sp. YFM]|uniref:helix-turn-helix transcriptional regulator n=1 Tax=Ferrimonas sp. YFM TaxID=3028878 RepID=UPI0025746153|nr:AlpA family phage regulatory protein [Ferrimonas sp. YFM]BDY03814.1 hypothetical protein F0521_08550 [Ferrimonas sp. YFM]
MTDRDRLISGPQLLGVVPFSRTRIYLMRRKGEFPEPVRIGGRNYWKESSIQKWLSELSNNKA